MAKEKKPAKKKVVKKPVTKKTAQKSVGAKKTVKKAAKKKAAVAAPKKKGAKKTKPKRKRETLMCFLTTACVRYYGLPDDGVELNTLRNYRDTYLAGSRGGKALIQEYYRISPAIVKRVEADPEKRSVYAFIYSRVLASCNKIGKQEPAAARIIYRNMVKTLLQKYKLN